MRLESQPSRHRPAAFALTALACLLAMPSSASAQTDAMLGLPLVITENGWARYTTMSSEGEVPVVVRVGAKGSHKGRSGRWIKLEVEVPDFGRMTLGYLIAGDRFLPENVLKMRAEFPGQKTEDNDDIRDEPEERAVLKGKVGKKGSETIAGKKLDTVEYLFPGTTAIWSSKVPGLGIVRVEGGSPMTLVDFGVGGDPWIGYVPKLSKSLSDLADQADALEKHEKKVDEELEMPPQVHRSKAAPVEDEEDDELP